MTSAPRTAHGGRLVAVIGAPAVGKSSMTRLAAETLGASVFRLREFAYRYRISHPELDHLFETEDPLGWFGDDTVKLLLGAAFDAMPQAVVVFLENLPGNAVQMRLLVELASAGGYGLELVELAAPDSVLAARSTSRRVCLNCEPDRRGDPHGPALASAVAPGACARCGGRLMARRSDQPHVHQTRLRRFRGQLPHIRAAAAQAGVPHRVVDATGERTSVSARFLAACATHPAAVVGGA